MKSKLILALFALVFAMTFTSCSYESVPVGNIGIKVNKLGGDKGVDGEAVGVGRYFLTWNEDIHLFPTYQVNYTYTAAATEGSPENEEFTFQTKEGMECSVDLGLTMHYDTDKIVKMFTTYRKGEDEIRSIVVRNAIRDALNKISGSMPVESVYGAGKGLLIDSVQSVVKSYLAPTGIIIDKISLIGSVRIPQTVLAALNAKVTMTQEAQKVENEVAKEKAQAQIMIIKAQAEADATRIKGDALKTNPAVLTQMAIEKWDGAYPTTIVGGNTVPMISIK